MSKPLTEIAWSFAKSRVLTVAVRAGVFDYLSNNTASIQQIATALNLVEAPTGKIIRALHSIGLLERKDQTYTLKSEYKLGWGTKDSPKAMLLHNHDMYERWGNDLEQWLTGGNSNEYLEQISDDPTVIFAEAMQSNRNMAVKALLDYTVFDGCGKLLDIGGGTGHFALAFLDKYPELKAVVLDLPETTNFAKQNILEHPLKDRIEFQAGDYLVSNYGIDFDLVLMSNILHQNTKDEVQKMLSRAYSCLKPTGMISILDFQIDEHKDTHEFGAFFAINMRSFGDTWSAKELTAFLQNSGFENIKFSNIDPIRWVVTAQKI